MTFNETLLIVDDERDILEVYRDYLSPGPGPALFRSSRSRKRATSSPKGPSFRPLTASTGEEAIELVEKELCEGRRVAGGFFDMKMPGGIDGLETIKRIRQLDRGVLCTVVTAYQDRTIDEIGRAFSDTAQDEWDYLNKPFTQHEIQQKARNLVHSWNRRRQVEELHDQLSTANQGLEQTVTDRTLELTRANDALEARASELASANAELRQARKELLERERLVAIGQLAAGVAHEINNPASFVTINLEQLRMMLVPEDGRPANEDALVSLLDDCDEGMRRIVTLARDLRIFARRDRSRRPAKVSTAIEKALTMTRSQVSQVGEVSLELDDRAWVVTPESRLVQLFINLILNAVHAMGQVSQPEHRLSIRSGDQEGKVWFEVSDTGCGIAEDELDSIFEPFFTTKSAGEGTGLGLSIVKDIVLGCDGTVSVDSTAGGGATFRIELPMAARDQAAVSLGEPEPHSASRPVVLLVDDEQTLLRSLDRALNPHFEIRVAGSMAEAIDVVDREGGIDAVVSDLTMRGGSGIDLFLALKGRAPKLAERFVVMTGGTLDEETRAFIATHHSTVLEKPFDPARLVSLVRALCE